MGIFKNKKAAEKILSIWWIFVLAIAGGGIVLGVLIYNSAEFDVRYDDSNLLAEKIVNCLVEQGKINPDFLKEDFDIFSECGLSKEVIDSDVFYINITLIDSSGEVLREPIYSGAKSFQVDCFINGKHYPRCSIKQEDVLYVKEGSSEIVKLKILAGSNQHGKRGAVLK
ncbi:MAG TPA: hypothetical protein VMZ91_11010 [Candidatus Paceibacterota bacterium]|nr:hypothetical protein [Candidatus Paceibacterota bacterium]